jgi:hypothetical protein
MKLIKKIFIILILTFIPILFIVPNLGNFFDISEASKQSDIIICLGGGTIERIEKTVELYKQDFSLRKIILLTGDNRTKKDIDNNINDERIQYLRENNIEESNFFHEKLLTSTVEEVIFIKKYLKENNYHSAIIVSDAPHTRRIKYLLENIAKEENNNLIFNLVKSDTKWWKKETYYLEKKAQTFVISESGKLLYSFVKYSIFDKLGLLTFFEKHITPIAKIIKKEVDSIIYKYLKNS